MPTSKTVTTLSSREFNQDTGPLPFRDALIAASALVHGMTVVTRNVAGFARTEVSLLNPWTVR